MQLAEFLARLPRGDLWIFGYGSLMWSPGFRFKEKSVALLHGYHRALCILSHRHRGTPERPGLVMGLCRGGSCWGIGFRVAATRVAGTLELLWEREMPNRVYFPRLVAARLSASRRARGAAHPESVRALAFIADPTHRQFIRELNLRGRARLVAQGIGERGHCIDYIGNTIEHMRELGVRDPHLERVLRAAIGLRRESEGRGR